MRECIRHDIRHFNLVSQNIENFDFRGSWRETYTRHLVTSHEPKAPLRIRGFFSDLLFQSWHVAHAPLQDDWLETENIEVWSAVVSPHFSYRRTLVHPRLAFGSLDAAARTLSEANK